MNDQELVDLYQWLRRLARRWGRQSGERALDSVGIRSSIGDLAASPHPVLLIGERGTGNHRFDAVQLIASSPPRGPEVGPMHRRHERLLSLISCTALFVAGTACEHPETTVQPPAVTIRDSADIEIVENHVPTWSAGEAWTVAHEPEFAIGGYNGEAEAADSSHLVWNISDAARLSDGGVAILSAGEKKLLLFEPTGDFAGSIGREGRGPGEFGYPEHLQVLPGDTLVVWDYMMGPVAYFDPTGNLLRQRSIDVGALFAATRTPGLTAPERVHMPLKDGSFMVQVGRSDWSPTPGELYRRPIRFMRIDSDHSAQSFGWWEGRERVLLAFPASQRVPFPPGAQLASGGTPLSVYVSNGDRYDVHQFSRTGALRRIIRRTTDPIPITATEIEEWKEAWASSYPPEGWPVWERAMAQLPPREYHPAVVGLLVDSDGYLWVADKVDRNASQWSVFDPAGRWLGLVTVPLQHVEWIGEDLILGFNFDRDLGLQLVEGYRLTR